MGPTGIFSKIPRSLHSSADLTCCGPQGQGVGEQPRLRLEVFRECQRRRASGEEVGGEDSVLGVCCARDFGRDSARRCLSRKLGCSNVAGGTVYVES